MNVKKYLLTLTILLAGCSWANSSADFYLTDKGIVQLKSLSNKVDQHKLKKLLGQGYVIHNGMHIKDNQLSKVFDVIKDNQLLFSVFTTEKGKLTAIEIVSPAIETAYKAHIGSKFAQLYEHDFGFCQRGYFTAEATEVICQAPNSKHIKFIFKGEWHGPKELIPSDNILKDWTVTKITWSAKS